MSKRLQPRNKIDRRLGCNLGVNQNLLSIEENMVLANTGLKKRNYLIMEFNFLLSKNLKGIMEISLKSNLDVTMIRLSKKEGILVNT